MFTKGKRFFLAMVQGISCTKKYSAIPLCLNLSILSRISSIVKASEPRYVTLDPFRCLFLPVPQSSTTCSEVSLGG